MQQIPAERLFRKTIVKTKRDAVPGLMKPPVYWGKTKM